MRMYVEHPHHVTCHDSLCEPRIPLHLHDGLDGHLLKHSKVESQESFGNYFGCLKSHGISLPAKWNVWQLASRVPRTSEAYKPGSSWLVAACISHMNFLKNQPETSPVLLDRSNLKPENFGSLYLSLFIPCSKAKWHKSSCWMCVESGAVQCPCGG